MDRLGYFFQRADLLPFPLCFGQTLAPERFMNLSASAAS
jgi:hypothetical protein